MSKSTYWDVSIATQQSNAEFFRLMQKLVDVAVKTPNEIKAIDAETERALQSLDTLIKNVRAMAFNQECSTDDLLSKIRDSLPDAAQAIVVLRLTYGFHHRQPSDPDN